LSEHAQIQQDVRTIVIISEQDQTLRPDFQWYRDSSRHTEAPLMYLEKLQDILVHKLPHRRSFHFRSRGEFDDRFHDLTPSDAIGTILGIVAVISLPVKSFVVDFGMWQVDATWFQMWQYHQPSFRSGWSHVRELSLSLSLTSGTFDWALGLIVHTTSLRKLSLVFQFDHSASFIERLCSSKVVHGLESLRLASAVVTSDKTFRARCSLSG